MSAVAAIYALLTGNTAVTTLATGGVFGGIVPQGKQPPALSINEISVVPHDRIDAASLYDLVTSRIQVTVIAKDYLKQKQLIDAVRKACAYQRGTIGGVTVNSITRDIVGPDMIDDDAKIYMQTIDFRVVHHDSNT